MDMDSEYLIKTFRVVDQHFHISQNIPTAPAVSTPATTRNTSKEMLMMKICLFIFIVFFFVLLDKRKHLNVT